MFSPMFSFPLGWQIILLWHDLIELFISKVFSNWTLSFFHHLHCIQEQKWIIIIITIIIFDVHLRVWQYTNTDWLLLMLLMIFHDIAGRNGDYNSVPQGTECESGKDDRSGSFHYQALSCSRVPSSFFSGSVEKK